MRLVATVATTALVVLTTGCVALPYATPPIEYAGSVGVATGPDPGVRLSVPLRGTLYPAGLSPRLYKRNWELGAGYVMMMPIDAPFYHGPFGEIGYYETYPIEGGKLPSMWRLGLKGAPTLVFRDTFNTPSIGGSLRITGEYVGFADGPYGDCGPDGCAFGYAWGESSVGLYGEVSHFVIDDGIWSVSAGLLVRAPATAGILFAWIYN